MLAIGMGPEMSALLKGFLLGRASEGLDTTVVSKLGVLSLLFCLADCCWLRFSFDLDENLVLKKLPRVLCSVFLLLPNVDWET